MSEINRISALDKLLFGIYKNRNVNFEHNKVIINDDGIKKTLFSPTSINNICLLIKVTFTCAEVVFADKKEGKSFNLTKDKVLENAIAYFRDLGIFIPEIANKTEKDLLKRRMYNALLEHILPAIFSNIDNEKKKICIEQDNISLEFNKAIQDINTEFNYGDFIEQLYTNIKSSDIEKLYDSNYSKNECNFGVLVCSARMIIFNKIRTVPTIYCYSNKKEYHNNAQKNKHDHFTEVTSLFFNRMALDNQNFVSPYYYIADEKNKIHKTETEPKEYKISFNVKVPNPNFIPRYFYFMTKLNEEIVEGNFSDCKSADMLNNELTKIAIDQIRIKYIDEITQYYKKALANIEDMCRRILAIDINKILSQDIHSIADLKEALSSLCNEDDIDIVWQLGVKNGLNAQQNSRYIYCSIENAMRGFLALISELSVLETRPGVFSTSDIPKPYLLLAIENYIPRLSIMKHKNTLIEIINNSKMADLSKLRAKYKNFNWNTKTGFDMYYRNDSDIFPDHDKNKDIYDEFQDSITAYCRTLNMIES